MYFRTAVLALVGGSVFIMALPVDFASGDTLKAQSELHQLEARWGSGKYCVDDNVYHRQLKPAIKKKFTEYDPKFTSKCGDNPDFIVDKSGMVYPEPQKAKSACPKNKYTLDLGALIQSYQH